MTTRKNSINRFTDEEFVELVKRSTSIRQVIDEGQWKVAGGTYAMLHKRIRRLGLDTSHMLGRGHNLGKAANNKKPLATYLVQDCYSISSAKLKKRLYDEGLKERMCEECGLTEWRGKPAPLQLDHENGDNTDNRLANLRILCANCHALTPTHSGRNKGKVGARRGIRTPTTEVTAS